MKSILFYFLILWFYKSNLYGIIKNKSLPDQTINFEHITIKDGLSSNFVSSIIQDSKGFLWIGTDDGLNRYDGYKFITYKNDPDNYNSLSNNKISTIYEDRAGILWIGCFNGGVNKFDSSNDTFVRYLHDPADPKSLGFNIVYCIYEDSKRELWIATDGGGLNKLNRKTDEFIHFKYNPNNPKSISSNRVSSIFEDDSGDLWIGTWGGGLNKFDRRKGNFVRYPNNPNDKYSPSSDRISLFDVNSGDIWIRTWGGGINKFNIETGIFEHYVHDPLNFRTISSNKVTSACEDDEQVLWVGTDIGGLNKFDIKNSDFVRYKHDPLDDNSLSSNRVTCVFKDRTGIIWIGTRDAGLNKYNRFKIVFEHYKNFAVSNKGLNNNNVLSFCEDQTGDIWIGTLGGGLNRFDPSKKSFINYSHNFKDPNSLSQNSVNSIFEDRHGTLWIGTRGGGLSKYDRTNDNFKHYKFEVNNNQSLSNNGVNSIYEDKKGTLWIGTYGGGLNKFDKETETFGRYTKGAKYNSTLLSIIKSLRKNETSVASILKVGNSAYLSQDYELKKREEILIVALGEGISDIEMWDYGWIENQNGEIIWEMEYEKSFYAGGAICNIMQICLDTLNQGKYTLQFKSNNEHSYEKWIALGPPNNADFWGVQIFLLSDDIKSSIRENINYLSEGQSISDNYITSIYEDKLGKLWIATIRGGINEFDPIKESFTVYMHDPQNTNSISDNYVYCIAEDNYGYLWIGTENGLNKLEQRATSEKSETFLHFTEKDGLPSNRILGILKDDIGNLWISTNKGLSYFNPTPNNLPYFINYDIKDGIQAYIFNERACLKYHDGKLYFGGINGFNSFYLPSLLDKHAPEIVLSEFRLLNMPLKIGSIDSPLQRHITYIDRIQLSHSENILSFEFAALDYVKPPKNKYAYRLDGLDENWIYTDAKRRFVTYTSLNPGEYVFRVKGSNSHGIWNEDGTSVAIIIAPPWWAAWWSYSLYLILSVSIIYALRRYDLKRIEYKKNLEIKTLEAKKLQEIDEMKSNFFTNISHEFRTPLTLLLGPSSDILDNTSEYDTKRRAKLIIKNAKKLLHLINQLLDLSKLDSGKLQLHASRMDIVDLAKKLALQFESYAAKNGKKLIFNGWNKPIEIYLDEEKFEKIINNLLSNAMKFTEKGDEISLNVKKTNSKSVDITVKDTGFGISKKMLPKIFERFYQVNHENGIGNIGTGVGLALTKELVELHRGSISVKSEMGKWTEFKIILPLGKDHLNEEEFIEQGEDLKVVTIDDIDGDVISETGYDYTELEKNYENKTVILVIEDNNEVRQYVKESIEKEYFIIEASDGEEGVLKAEKFVPDLIISDLVMPKIDGNKLIQILKKSKHTNHIPIIMLTAISEQDAKLKGLSSGVDDFITKPFDKKELLFRIKNLINIRRTLQSKYQDWEESQKIIQRNKFSGLNEQFMKKVMEIIEDHISEEEFGIEQFAVEVGMSRMQLHRKLKALTGLSASLYIRTIKLEKAKRMIFEGKGNISEISYALGFNSQAYFTKCFKEKYGYPPSELQSNQ